MSTMFKLLIAATAALASIGCFVGYFVVHSPVLNLIGVGLIALGLFALQSAVRSPRQ